VGVSHGEQFAPTARKTRLEGNVCGKQGFADP
jgi:hypothetical protein